MSMQIETLFAIAALNGVLSYIILRGRRDSLSISYFLVVFSVAIWSLFLGLFLIEENYNLALNFSVIYYIAAAAIPTLFLIFSLTLAGKLNKLFFFVFLTPFIFLVVNFLLNKNLLIQNIIFVGNNTKDVILNKSAYIFYIIYFVFYVISAYLVLFKRYRILIDDLKKKQILLIIIGTSVSYFFGMIFNLIIPFFENYRLVWVGPLFTVFMIGTIAYAIFRHQLFNISIVLVEITLILLNFFLLVNLIFSEGGISLTVNVALYVSVLFFSGLLLRGIYKDIRDRERIEGLVKEMEVANERLRAMEQQKTEFVSIASHQLRTPLTVIKGYASMILEGTFGAINDVARDALENLFKSSEKIVALVDDLLTVSRIEQGRMMLNFETINLKGLVQKVLTEMQGEIDEAKINLSFSAEDEEDFFVAVDEKKFKQVVHHILDNAIKYTPQHGSVRVTIVDDAITNNVRLIVSDTGEGMNEEQITAIFERFNLKNEQAEYSENQARQDFDAQNLGGQAEKGTHGIGLYIAQEIISAHHGKLSIESDGKDMGTSVTVEIPRAYSPKISKV
ncbi:hypothetical protein EPN27_03620 [Patescibacteria group bacterium]|nr:MAG: hypothetical protein EPN27_03620 [Patescibacteria group bacterium]